MKKYFIAVCMLAAAVGASAQIEDDDKQLFNHLGAGVSVGMDGIGINLATTITPYVQARAGYNFLPEIKVKDIEVDVNIDGNNEQVIKNAYKAVTGKDLDIPRNVLIDGKINMNNFKLLFDIYPSKTSAWRLTVGFYAGKSQIIDAYTTNCQEQLSALTAYNEIADDYNAGKYASVVPAGAPETLPIAGVKLGDYLVKPNGPEARAFLKVNGFKPYVGIGSGRAISNKHRFSFAWDLGCQFWGTPTIYVQDKPLDKEGVDGDGGVIKTISKITVYPTFSFRFNGRIL